MPGRALEAYGKINGIASKKEKVKQCRKAN